MLSVRDNNQRVVNMSKMSATTTKDCSYFMVLLEQRRIDVLDGSRMSCKATSAASTPERLFGEGSNFKGLQNEIMRR